MEDGKGGVGLKEIRKQLGWSLSPLLPHLSLSSVESSHSLSPCVAFAIVCFVRAQKFKKKI